MIKIDKEKLRRELGVKSYSECCALAGSILAIISIITVLCLVSPTMCKLIVAILIIAAAICSLGYLIYRLVN